MVRPKFDGECESVLESISEALPPAIDVSRLGILRPKAGDPSLPSDEDLSVGGLFRVTHCAIPQSGDGPVVPVMICAPRAAKVRGAIVYLHGGGMVGGDVRQGMVEVLDWAAEHDLAVFSVDYRLAPEDPYPAASEDVYRALLWVDSGAHDLGSLSGRIVVAGVSAGGGLAASMLLRCRDLGGPMVLGALLAGPMLDDRNMSVSARQMKGVGVWDQSSNEMGWRAFLGDDHGKPDISPYAVPARATNLYGLPPIYIDVGSAETFRDEAVEFASRLWGDGGDCELHVWPGGFHAYASLAPGARISVATRNARKAWLRRVLG